MVFRETLAFYRENHTKYCMVKIESLNIATGGKYSYQIFSTSDSCVAACNSVKIP
jgi:hypothetical protein